MGFRRYFLHHLRIKRHAAFDAAHLRQQPVVKSPAASQPVSAPVKSDRREPESNRTAPAEFPRNWRTVRECRISRRQCPSLNFEPVAPNRFGWRSRKRAGRRFSSSAAIFPATARHPVRPAAARRTESCVRSATGVPAGRKARWIPPPGIFKCSLPRWRQFFRRENVFAELLFGVLNLAFDWRIRNALL